MPGKEDFQICFRLFEQILKQLALEEVSVQLTYVKNRYAKFLILF